MLIVILALLDICVKHKFSPKLLFLMLAEKGSYKLFELDLGPSM